MGRSISVDDLIGRIYDAAMAPELWPDTIACIADAAGCRSGILYEHDIVADHSTPLGFHRLDPDFVRDYENHVGALDPWNKRAIGWPVGVVAPTYALISDDELRRTEFYQDHLRPIRVFYGLGGVVERSRGRMAVFGVQHSYEDGRFSAEAWTLVGKLMPHIGRAYRMQAAIRDTHRRSETLEQTLHAMQQPVLVVEPDARLVFANRAAERLLVEGDGVRFTNGRVIAAHRGDQVALTALLHPLEPPDRAATAITLRRPRARTPLLVRAVPLRPNRRWDPAVPVVLLIEMEAPPAAPIERLTTLFTLTTAEARLWSALLSGATLTEIARRNRVSVNTLRVQLGALFRKVGVHRQADLVRLGMECRTARTDRAD